MDKIRIRTNYEDYERVKQSFKNFVHALVWESMDIDAGVEEDEINKHIEMFCKQQGEKKIAEINDSVSKFICSLTARYEVHLYEMNDNGDVIEETAKHINTDNLNLALKKGAEFYRSAKNPQVNIFDNETAQYIAEWD